MFNIFKKTPIIEFYCHPDPEHIVKDLFASESSIECINKKKNTPDGKMY